jgi:hypothetical protein
MVLARVEMFFFWSSNISRLYGCLYRRWPTYGLTHHEMTAVVERYPSCRGRGDELAVIDFLCLSWCWANHWRQSTRKRFAVRELVWRLAVLNTLKDQTLLRLPYLTRCFNIINLVFDLTRPKSINKSGAVTRCFDIVVLFIRCLLLLKWLVKRDHRSIAAVSWRCNVLRFGSRHIIVKYKNFLK